MKLHSIFKKNHSSMLLFEILFKYYVTNKMNHKQRTDKRFVIEEIKHSIAICFSLFIDQS
jgi:hypothetical protein